LDKTIWHQDNVYRKYCVNNHGSMLEDS